MYDKEWFQFSIDFSNNKKSHTVYCIMKINKASVAWPQWLTEQNLEVEINIPLNMIYRLWNRSMYCCQASVLITFHGLIFKIVYSYIIWSKKDGLMSCKLQMFALKIMPVLFLCEHFRSLHLCIYKIGQWKIIMIRHC